MSGKCQIVPALAAAVHGVTEELPLLPEIPSPELIRSRLASITSSTSSTNIFRRSLSTSSNPQTISQVNAQKAFAYFDKNRDGKLSIKEFKSVMHDLGYKTVDKRFIRQVFAEANRNGNRHVLSYDEFVEFLEPKLSLRTNDQLRLTEDLNTVSLPKMQFDIETLFNCYDLDKNGFIEPKELRKVMQRLLGEKLSKQDIEEMISVADRNGDGLLDKSEFALLCSAF
jgi:Ca2+-binding EF-hand superfamily protein